MILEINKKEVASDALRDSIPASPEVEGQIFEENSQSPEAPKPVQVEVGDKATEGSDIAAARQVLTPPAEAGTGKIAEGANYPLDPDRLHKENLAALIEDAQKMTDNPGLAQELQDGAINYE